MGKGNRKRIKQAADELAMKDALQRTYWHGGSARRNVGDVLVPGATLAKRGTFQYGQKPDGWANEYRPDFAYITTDRDLAYDFAVRHAWNGFEAALYEVKPVGTLMHDPDYPKGISFRCLSAIVVATEPDVITAANSESGASHSYMTWDDGEPLYDGDGYGLPNKTGRHFGVTDADLKSLGAHPEFDQIEAHSSSVILQRNPSVTAEEVSLVRRSFGVKIK